MSMNKLILYYVQKYLYNRTVFLGIETNILAFVYIY